METNEPSELDSLILGEIQVLLSEKRTALSHHPHRDRRFRFTAVRPECADRDLT